MDKHLQKLRTQSSAMPEQQAACLTPTPTTTQAPNASAEAQASIATRVIPQHHTTCRTSLLRPCGRTFACVQLTVNLIGLAVLPAASVAGINVPCPGNKQTAAPPVTSEHSPQVSVCTEH